MFRVHLFVPKEMEDDQHVTEYRWVSDTTEEVHPPYYALYFCPHCYFTDLADDYREPARSKTGRWVVKTFGSFKPETDRLVEFLGRHVDYANIDYRTALTLHYLAALVQSNVADDFLDTFKLSRLYLRLAWLYREAAVGKELPGGPHTCAGQPYFSFPSYEAFLQTLKGLWPEAPLNEQEAIQASCRYLSRAISSDSRFDRPNKYYQGVKLLLSLLQRCGDLEGAYDTVRGIYLEGMKSRMDCQRILADSATSTHRREQVAADLRVVNTYMSDAGELRDELLGQLVERDYPKVIEVVRANAGLPPKEMEKAVLGAGVLPEVWRRIQERASSTKK